MGRLNHLLENGTQPATAAYGPANEMTSLSYYGNSETRTYNNLLQLTRQTVPGKFDTQYVFAAGQNNGQISAAIDHISGQQVNYTYDSLKRLSTARDVRRGMGPVVHLRRLRQPDRGVGDAGRRREFRAGVRSFHQSRGGQCAIRVRRQRQRNVAFGQL